MEHVLRLARMPAQEVRSLASGGFFTLLHLRQPVRGAAVCTIDGGPL